MRTAILCALLAAVPLSSFAANQGAQPQQQQQENQKQPPQSESKQPVKQQDKKPAPSPSTTESISPLLPHTPPQPDSAKPPSPETGVPGAADPAKMAAGPSGTVAAVGAKPQTSAGGATYIIGADDEISIIVFENSAFNVPIVSVRPDGKITMPLLGELEAAGKSPEQLTKEITDTLTTNYMNITPHVSVGVVRVLSKNYYINGEVYKPGKYPLTVPTTIMQALVNAGGFKDFANKKKIRILHKDGKTDFFNYNEVSNGKKLDQNILLQPDDQIFVK